MIGPILIAISWILLRLEGKGLRELGFDTPRRRMRQFLIGFFVMGCGVALHQIALSLATGASWALNPAADTTLLLQGLRLNVNSVLFEELAFRGYLLYQALRWLGTKRGVLLDAAAFGVYHWFSYGVLDNPVLMALVFLLTGAFGLMTALAFAKTRSVAAPIGLHLGWNLIGSLVFSTGPFGPGFLIPADGAARIEAPGALGLALNIGLPIALVAGVSAALLWAKPRDKKPG